MSGRRGCPRWGGGGTGAGSPSWCGEAQTCFFVFLFSSLPTLLLPVTLQRFESSKDCVLEFNGILNLLILVIWTLRYFITEFLISEKFMNTIEKIF